jgi:hypothetical protein
MKSLTRLLAAIVMAGAMNCASATLLSFAITGVGSYTLNTGDITALTTLKTLPATELVGGTTTPVSFVQAGLVTGAPVVFSTLILHTFLGPDTFTISAGFLTLSFSDVVFALIHPTGGPTDPGSISLQFSGLVTGDASIGTLFLNQTVTLSQTCTQTQQGAAISCSESVQTPGVQRQAPEPISVALLGIGLAALGFARRRKS